MNAQGQLMLTETLALVSYLRIVPVELLNEDYEWPE